MKILSDFCTSFLSIFINSKPNIKQIEPNIQVNKYEKISESLNVLNDHLTDGYRSLNETYNKQNQERRNVLFKSNYEDFKNEYKDTNSQQTKLLLQNFQKSKSILQRILKYNEIKSKYNSSGYFKIFKSKQKKQLDKVKEQIVNDISTIKTKIGFEKIGNIFDLINDIQKIDPKMSKQLREEHIKKLFIDYFKTICNSHDRAVIDNYLQNPKDDEKFINIVEEFISDSLSDMPKIYKETIIRIYPNLKKQKSYGTLTTLISLVILSIVMSYLYFYPDKKKRFSGIIEYVCASLPNNIFGEHIKELMILFASLRVSINFEKIRQIGICIRNLNKSTLDTLTTLKNWYEWLNKISFGALSMIISPDYINNPYHFLTLVNSYPNNSTYTNTFVFKPTLPNSILPNPILL